VIDEDTTRRHFLGACVSAVAAGLAGCSLAPETETPDDSPSGDDRSPGTTTGATDRTDGTADSMAYESVYQQTIDSVVQIRVFATAGSASGTGFVYDRSGRIVTNQHVVADADDIYVRFTRGGWKEAQVLGTDIYSDLAVISVPSIPQSATALPIRATDPAVGTEVMAIGNPFGFSGSLSTGVVSGVNRTLQGRTQFGIPDAIQTDAPVNPGNSGGPLVDRQGRVVGVINSGGGDNIGFAISSALMQRVAPALIADGEYEHVYMGVGIRPVGPLIAQANDIPSGNGVYITEVFDDSPSDGVLQGADGNTVVNNVEVPTGGDVIVRMNDTPIKTDQAMSSFLALETSPGDTIEVTVLRDGERTTVELTLGERPEPSV